MRSPWIRPLVRGSFGGQLQSNISQPYTLSHYLHVSITTYILSLITGTTSSLIDSLLFCGKIVRIINKLFISLSAVN